MKPYTRKDFLNDVSELVEIDMAIDDGEQLEQGGEAHLALKRIIERSNAIAKGLNP